MKKQIFRKKPQITGKFQNQKDFKQEKQERKEPQEVNASAQKQQEHLDALEEQVRDDNHNLQNATRYNPVHYANVDTKRQNKHVQKMSHDNNNAIGQKGMPMDALIDDQSIHTPNVQAEFTIYVQHIKEITQKISLPIAMVFNGDNTPTNFDDLYNAIVCMQLGMIAQNIASSICKKDIIQTRWGEFDTTVKAPVEMCEIAQLHGDIPMKTGNIQMVDSIHNVRCIAMMALQQAQLLGLRLRQLYDIDPLLPGEVIGDFEDNICFRHADPNYTKLKDQLARVYDSVEHTEDMHAQHVIPMQHPHAEKLDELLLQGQIVPGQNFGFVNCYQNFLVNPVATMANGIQRAALQVCVVPERITDDFLIKNLRKIMAMADQILSQQDKRLKLVEWKPAGTGKFAQLFVRDLQEIIRGSVNQEIPLEKEDIAVGMSFCSTTSVKRFPMFGELSLRDPEEEILELEAKMTTKQGIT